MSTMSSQSIDESLYSRQLYTLGEDSMRKLNKRRVLIWSNDKVPSGLDIEICKNIILAGPKQVDFKNERKIEMSDLTTNFYCSENDLGKKVSEVSVLELKGLNNYVDVNSVSDELTEDFLSNYEVFVSVNFTKDENIKLNNLCRKTNTKFIFTRTSSVFGEMFSDFGEEFKVSDATGEKPKEGIIENCIFNEDGTLLVFVEEKTPHKLSTGDVVKLTFKGIKNENKSSYFKIVVLDSFRFTVSSNGLSGNFISGSYNEKKMPNTFTFKTYEDNLKEPNIMYSDFSYDPHVLHECFKNLSEDNLNTEKVIESCEKNLSEKEERMVRIFSKTFNGNVITVNSFMGGMVSQEIVKGCSDKYTPTNQFLYYEASDTVPDEILKEDFKFKLKNDRYDGMRKIYGDEVVSKMFNQKIFMVGAGAIGCELLKNFVMMGYGTGEDGHIYVTDMDMIEKSNLNRQFLFRPADLQKPKSQCAVNAVQKINPAVNATSYNLKVGEETLNFFDSNFFNKLDFVANALDNIEARKFVDNLCVNYGKPLLESGTKGTQGNTQIIVPRITKSYSDYSDGVDHDIPVCTVKSFPYKIEHTVKWATEKFGMFTESPTNVQKYIDNPDIVKNMDSSELGQFYDSIKPVLVDNFSSNSKECFEKALEDWFRHYRDDVKNTQLLFPKDKRNDDGTLFWKGTKTYPELEEFNLENETHFNYVFSMGNLLADLFGFERINNKDKVMEIIKSKLKQIPDFVPNSEFKVKTEEQKDSEEETDFDLNSKYFEKYLPHDKFKDSKINQLEFEKDDDTNYHIDFITACSNMRNKVYGIETGTRSEIKGIAGKIIPAMATTTAVVAGEISSESIKLVQDFKDISKFRESYINLATTVVSLYEAGKSNIEFELNDKKYTKWDLILKTDESMTLREFIDWSKNKLDYEKNELDILSIYFLDEKTIYFEGLTKDEFMDMKLEDIIKQKFNFDVKSNVFLTFCTYYTGEEMDKIDNPDYEYIFTVNYEPKKVKKTESPKMDAVSSV